MNEKKEAIQTRAPQLYLDGTKLVFGVWVYKGKYKSYKYVTTTFDYESEEFTNYLNGVQKS